MHILDAPGTVEISSLNACVVVVENGAWILEHSSDERLTLLPRAVGFIVALRVPADVHHPEL